MRRIVCLLVLLAGCASTWERHQQRQHELEAAGDYRAALGEQRWLVDNAFGEAPRGLQNERADAARHLHLARLATQTGDLPLAIRELREVLTIDPRQAPAVRAAIDRLPVSDDERARLQHEFAWNIAALAPADDTLAPGDRERSRCWSYDVRQIRVRRDHTVSTPTGSERRVVYDARPWRFDAAAGRWHATGDWVENAGTEVGRADGPEPPRLRAVRAADGGFYAETPVPPCHRNAWQGPFDAAGTLFVTMELPVTSDAQPTPAR